ncbi:acyltransferase [Micrococcus yunnanensis]|uniref:acyltransferase n=1 Tax=Micrococcus yunnanensis TaxID=566027 RepID=UPI00107279CD|nr:DapH/DapD/GlmU-related protein [Micrococcus yunnanensis]MBF0744105.1 acyltransferase [Micrococcus yunnanensis]TFU55981.1 acyltransferase [Micrococcus yunnanensis]
MKIPGGATARRLALAAARSEVLPNRHRPAVLSRLGLVGAEHAKFSAGVRILDPGALTIGEGVFLNREVYIDNGPVTLGRNVYMGPRAMIITAKHSLGGPELRAGDGGPEPVVIGDGTWIGAGAIILPGVTVGAGCIVAAGAVVTKDCAPNGLYAGVPARRLRDLDEADAA